MLREKLQQAGAGKDLGRDISAQQKPSRRESWGLRNVNKNNAKLKLFKPLKPRATRRVSATDGAAGECIRSSSMCVCFILRSLSPSFVRETIFHPRQ
jgi:hypothetical protein